MERITDNRQCDECGKQSPAAVRIGVGLGGRTVVCADCLRKALRLLDVSALQELHYGGGKPLQENDL